MWKHQQYLPSNTAQLTAICYETPLHLLIHQMLAHGGSLRDPLLTKVQLGRLSHGLKIILRYLRRYRRMRFTHRDICQYLVFSLFFVFFLVYRRCIHMMPLCCKHHNTCKDSDPIICTMFGNRTVRENELFKNGPLRWLLWPTPLHLNACGCRSMTRYTSQHVAPKSRNHPNISQSRTLGTWPWMIFWRCPDDFHATAYFFCLHQLGV